MYIHIFSSYVTLGVTMQQICWVNKRWSHFHSRSYERSRQDITFPAGIYTLEEAIWVAEQKDFSVKKAHVSSNSYLPPKQQESGGSEPMDLCYADSERSRGTDYKTLQRFNRCYKTGSYGYKCSAPRAVPRTVGNSNCQAARRVQIVGPTLLRKMQHRNG